MGKAAETITKLAVSLRPLMNFDDVAEGSSYSIGQLASHLGVSLRTLRFYEQAGLLRPTREGLRRIYSEEDRERLEVIVTLREFEVSLPAIKSLMSTIDGGGPNIEDRIRDQFSSLLEVVRKSNLTRIAELEGINSRIDLVRSAASD